MHKWQNLIPLQQKLDSYVPTQEQLNEYAEYIGICLPEDEDLMWIAKEGIQANLPQNWQACRDITAEEDDYLYRNIVTRELTTEHPMDLIYRNKVAEMKLLKHKIHLNQTVYEEQSFSSANPLSEIQEEEHDAYNDSEVFESKKISSPSHKFTQNFKITLPIQSEAISENKLSGQQRKSKQMQKYTWNSQLDRNINASEQSFKQSKESDVLQRQTNAKRILPESLADLEIKSKEIGRLYDKIDTELTVKLEQYSKQDLEMKSEAKKLENLKVKMLQKELERLEKEEQLKIALLQQLKSANLQKMEKIKRKIHKRKQKQGII